MDENGRINPDGFYNYITGWYNVDNMMYYVSQASFFPNPPAWALTKVTPTLCFHFVAVYLHLFFYLHGFRGLYDW